MICNENGNPLYYYYVMYSGFFESELKWRERIQPMINILLCDDDKNDLNSTTNYLYFLKKHWKDETQVITFQDAKLLLEYLRDPEEKKDILLIDIDMPDISGLEIARLMQEEEWETVLIFLTAHEEYVYTSFAYQPLRYIRKEYMKQELPSALEAAFAKIRKKRGYSMTLKTTDGLVSVFIPDISHFQIEHRKMYVYMINGECYACWKKIRELKEEVDALDGSFEQVHKSCVVNLRHVKTLRSGSIILVNGTEIPISRTYQPEFTKIMTLYWSDEY